MDINGSRVLNYSDLVKGLDPKGNFEHRVVDIACQENEMLQDMTVIEANDGTSLVTKVRTETPTATWTGFYHGIKPNKSSKTQIKVSSARLGAQIVIDRKLFDDNKSQQSALLEDEVRQAMEGMNIDMAKMMVYGDLANNPMGFNGLCKSYDKYGATNSSESAHYVLSALGTAGAATNTTNLGSIFLVGWGPGKITAFHPQGSKTGGISVSERQNTRVTDPENGGTYAAYVTDLDWQLGLAVEDFRFGGRICNIQRDLMLTPGKEADYIELLDRLFSRVREKDAKQCLYMDRMMWENIQVLYSRMTRANAITYAHIDSRKERRIYGTPVRIQEVMEVAELPVAAFGA